MQQNVTSFKPTPKMLKLAQSAMNIDISTSVTAWCEHAGVSRVQWYRWKQQAGFIEWFNTIVRQQLEEFRAHLLSEGIKRALSGDFRFWKVLMEKMGEYLPNHSMNAGVENKIVVLHPKDGAIQQVINDGNGVTHVISNVPFGFDE